MTSTGPSPSAALPTQPASGRLALLLEGALGLCLLALFTWLFLRGLSATPALPYSDESAHLTKLLELYQRLRAAPSWPEWLHRLLLGNDSYPNLAYAVSLAFPPARGSLLGARLSLLLYPLLHAALALWVARATWGRAGAWGYAVLILLSPLALAYAPLYFVDVPLVATVGIALLLLERSDGFRHPGWSAAFALCAVAGLHGKWTWALFVSVPLLVAALRALYASHARWGWRLASAALSAAGVAGIGLAIVRIGRGMPTQGGPLQGARLALPLGLVLGGLALGLLWPLAARLLAARGRALRPIANLWAATLVIALSAGTWYALVMPHLLGRFDHEQTQWLQRGGNGPQVVQSCLETVRLFAPALGCLLGIGLVLEIWRWRSAWSALPRLLAAGLAFQVIASTLPFDPRYLLPLAPVLAGACVAGWRNAPRPLRRGLLALILLACLVGLLGPYLPRRSGGRELVVSPPVTWAADRLELGPVWLPLTSARGPGDPLGKAALQELVAGILERCSGPRCEARYLPQLQGAQGRAIAVLAAFGGTWLQVQEPQPQEGALGRLVLRPLRTSPQGPPAPFREGTDCETIATPAGGGIELCSEAAP